MAALRGYKIASSYHVIGRVNHRRTGIDDQTQTMIFLLGPTYPTFDEVACPFPDPEV